MGLTFGTYPHPGYLDITAEMADKPEGRGWNNLGKRQPKFIALHRMVGTLAGTRQHFGNPSVASLTDYGLGIRAVDGDKAGVIHLYNNPRGYRSGWASGPVSAPYGDGKCIVTKYGINAVNRDGVSIETSGTDEPLDDFSWGELVKLCAYWADQMQVPYVSLPRNPHTGCNLLIWHQEFTIGTGKKCPFTWLMQNTERLYADIAAALKPYQEGEAVGPGPTPPREEQPPAPKYAPPLPIEALALLDPVDHDRVAAITTSEGAEFVFVSDRVRATRDTPRLQYASATAPRIGPDIKGGEAFDAMWLVKAHDGHWYYLTEWWTRVRADHTERLED